jgi:multidrug efflux pump subunit AcrB
VIVAFLGLLLTDRTINVISLAGMAFALGMTLDNSIVVLESIESERRRTVCIASAVLVSTCIILFLTPAAEYLPEGEEPRMFSTTLASKAAHLP